ncbi:VanZ family protein [Haloplanus aerogenes]|uniref:VanZ family protein n=1 Tax=Haloplanus aerogenes TaxID=660522 RepID=A0A3M0CXQ3_9EURY|nr:VanZ family protein [Haloplanus aerogenes]AZH24890.1 VanZ family protein [Haloplanus aerogenes]RMB13901.1 VanZ family protein [Haloplanus aerogenes]
MAGRRVHLPLVPRSIRWLLVIAVLAAILVFSIVRPPGTGRLVTGPFGVLPLSTWLHAIGYAGLALVLAYALQSSPRPNWQLLCLVFGFATAYGVGMELIQSTLAYRTFDPADILVNAVAAALTVVGWTLLVRRVRFYRCRRLDALQPPLG